MVDLMDLPVGRPEYIEHGTKWLQSIDEIVETMHSIDKAVPNIEYYKPENADFQGAYYLSWHNLLGSKREDDHYPDVCKSLRENGWVRPVTVYFDGKDIQFGDGHHRLAAAIEMGMRYIPVEAMTDQWTCVSNDSGDWDSSCDIPEHNNEAPTYDCWNCGAEFSNEQDANECEYSHDEAEDEEDRR